MSKLPISEALAAGQSHWEGCHLHDFRHWNCAVEHIADLTAKLAEAEAWLRELQGSYAEAIDDIQDWAGYASDYFRDKYQLAATIERHETALVKST